MKIAVTIWGNRISPVFDAAQTLLIAKIRNGIIVKKSYQSFDPYPASQLIKGLKEMEISTLICGAISTGPADQITSQGIRLVSFVTGNALSILDNFATREFIGKDHVMPGCCCPYLKNEKKMQ